LQDSLPPRPFEEVCIPALEWMEDR
jgi:hypothetical protein